MFWWLWRLLFDPSGSTPNATPPLASATLDFDHAREVALGFDHVRSVALDFDHVRSVTLDF